jgi:hypothetical protein
MNHAIRNSSLLVLACSTIAFTASAEMITFDEMAASNGNCCYLTTEYADQSATFVTTDDGSIWGGLSNGNPGTWFLEGTNGPAFLGFNGASFSASMLFDSPINGFSLDMAPSIGWYTMEDVFTLEGYLGGVLVDSVSNQPLPFAEWMTVELVGDIDEVLMVSEGPTFPNTYGIDNLVWQAAGPGVPDVPDDSDEPGIPEMMSIEIDVKPWHKRNVVNPMSRGATRVAVFGSDELDVTSIDMKSLRMGPGTATMMKHTRVRDINRDGFADLLSVCRTRDLGLALGDAEICMSGTTVEGQPFEGCDVIDTMPRARERHSDRSHRRRR